MCHLIFCVTITGIFLHFNRIGVVSISYTAGVTAMLQPLKRQTYVCGKWGILCETSLVYLHKHQINEYCVYTKSYDAN